MHPKAEHRDVERLRKIAKSAPQTEEAVLYILVVCRRITEELDSAVVNDKYAFLRMCIDWCLHSSVTKSPARKDLLRSLEDGYREHGFALDIYENEQLNFGRLRREIQRFCDDHHVEVSWINDSTSWKQFMRLYARVVGHSPLIPAKGWQFTNIENVVLRFTNTSHVDGNSAVFCVWDSSKKVNSGASTHYKSVSIKLDDLTLNKSFSDSLHMSDSVQVELKAAIPKS